MIQIQRNELCNGVEYIGIFVTRLIICGLLRYSWTPVIPTLKGNEKQIKLARNSSHQGINPQSAGTWLFLDQVVLFSRKQGSQYPTDRPVAHLFCFCQVQMLSTYYRSELYILIKCTLCLKNRSCAYRPWWDLLSMPAISVDKYTPQSMLSESNCLQNMLIIYALGPVHEEFGVGIKAIPKAFSSRNSRPG